MNPALLGLLVVVAIGLVLYAFLAIGGGLIHTSLKRRKAVALGGRNIPSRILDDLQPIEDLLVDFVRHSPELAAVLSVVASGDNPRSFARIVHEIRIARVTPTGISIAVHLVGAALGILFVAGLIRVARDGFMATNAGLEVQRRLDQIPDAAWQSQPQLTR
jgi:hypothetical protein